PARASGHHLTWRHCVEYSVVSPGAHRRSNTKAATEVSAWRRMSDRIDHAAGLLPRQPAEHLHGSAYAGDDRFGAQACVRTRWPSVTMTRYTCGVRQAFHVRAAERLF